MKLKMRDINRGFTKFNLYDKVVLIEDCVINNRKRAEKGDKGVILTSYGTYGDKTTVKFYHLEKVIHYIPIDILEKAK